MGGGIGRYVLVLLEFIQFNSEQTLRREIIDRQTDQSAYRPTDRRDWLWGSYNGKYNSMKRELC